MSNTFLKIQKGCTLRDLTSYVGSDSVSQVLNVNGLQRQRDVYSQYEDKCHQAVQSNDYVDWKRKSEILNIFSTDSDVFEYACVQSEDNWKILSSMMSFADAIAVPETVQIVKSDEVLGNGEPVSSTVYNSVMSSLKKSGTVDTSVFNDFSTIKPSVPLNLSTSSSYVTNSLFQAFKIPFGDVTFYSSLSDSSVDIPAYPEEVRDPRTASYTTMPDTLYQYEPWYTYTSSGPREVTLEFHLHRQMWTGDETDGLANKMIRFVQACLYPKYNGSSVTSDICTLYIKGKSYITGIVTAVDVTWTGPIGSDGFYLEFTLSVSFTEISQRQLNNDSVKSMALLG